MSAHAAEAAPERFADISMTVVMTMRQMGVLGLPRNYEIFYEALSGSNPELGSDLASLGLRPKQADLDRLGWKYFAQNHGPGIMENAGETVSRQLDEVVRIMLAERTYLEKYGRILDQAAEGLNSRHLLTRDILQKIAGVMANATASTIDHGKQAVSSLDDSSGELETVRTKLEEYKRLAETDPLTHIWNRRAFDRRIAAIYDTTKGVMFSALLIADIDRFKDINDRYGHPVGDKIIQIVAGILRASSRGDMFVARTGGEEFALIVEGGSVESTMLFAERLRTEIAGTPFTNSHTHVSYGPVTISIGVCMASDATGPEDLYAKADRALYRSKAGGRNQSTLHNAAPDRRSKEWLLYKSE